MCCREGNDAMTRERWQAECPRCHQVIQALLDTVGEGAELDCPHFAFRIDRLVSDQVPLNEVMQWALPGHGDIPDEDVEKARRAIENAVGETLERVGDFFFGDEEERGKLGRRLQALFGSERRAQL